VTSTRIERMFIEMHTDERRAWLVERGWLQVETADWPVSTGWRKGRSGPLSMAEAIAVELGNGGV
jgi:hypothetical protein